MFRRPISRLFGVVLALSVLIPAWPGGTLADDDDRRHRRERDYERHRGHHHGHYRDHERYRGRDHGHHRDRDRYIQEYYERRGHDRDYRRWERNRERWSDRDYQRWYRSRQHDDGDDNRKAVIAGIFGLAAGAVLGTALSQQGQAAPQGYSYQAAPTYSGSSDWHQYCASKYRSFNPQTGMYRGYDGQLRPCR